VDLSGRKSTLVGAPDADILGAAIEILRKRIAVGTTIFFQREQTFSWSKCKRIEENQQMSDSGRHSGG